MVDSIGHWTKRERFDPTRLEHNKEAKVISRLVVSREDYMLRNVYCTVPTSSTNSISSSSKMADNIVSGRCSTAAPFKLLSYL